MSDDAPYLAPYGRHLFFCDGALSDHCDPEQQVPRLQAYLASKLGKLGDYMDPNRVKVSASSCLGVCMGGPILAVYPDGVWYHHVDKALIDRIIEEHLRNNRPVLEWAFYVRDGDAAAAGSLAFDKTGA